LTLTTLSLVLLAALIHATWNLLAKKAGGGAAFVLLGVIATSMLYAPVILVWWWRVPNLLSDVTAMQWFFIALSSLIHIGYSLSLQRGYQLADYGVVYPVARGTGPLLSSIVAIVFLGEAVTLFSGLGIVAIVSGIFILAGGLRIIFNRARANDAVSEASALSGTRARAGVRWGVTTGLFIALYTTLDGYAVKVLAIAPLFLDYFCNLLRVVFLCPLFARNRSAIAIEWRKNWKYIVAIAAISPIAYILVLTAMQSAPISHVAPLRELSMLFAAVFGATLLGERQLREKFLGAGLMLAGVVGVMWH
jgi:drug/metabolite transporter (DMT)-like permease